MKDLIWMTIVAALSLSGAVFGGIALRGERRHECTVRDIQRNVTTIRVGALKYEGQGIVCELGG